jgi:hypothetical protein
MPLDKRIYISASEGRHHKLCTHVKAKSPLARGSLVPEVGLEPHSNPCKHWELPKTYAIRANPADVRPSPAAKVCTMCTPPNSPLRRLPSTDRTHVEGVRSFIAQPSNPRIHPRATHRTYGTPAGTKSGVRCLAGIGCHDTRKHHRNPRRSRRHRPRPSHGPRAVPANPGRNGRGCHGSSSSIWKPATTAPNSAKP